MQCTECGGEMRVVEVTYQSLDSMGIQIERGLTYFDSG
ncbi:hypothetical protein Pla100_17390 [Neorhodopirellula pilleata]|uniref:Uncharacterized protein n=2 Tax=Neorhodopirellula pilleata TaxID=2714738 RepID=A0A5C6APQ1_9BACT|nr:hypothetical protein Pla100_17390 [Neorhodopirellula pilleata]